MAEGRMPFRVIILHGAHGGPDTNWFPWLHATLEAEGIEVVRPRFPTPEGQSLAAWLDAYDLAVKSLPFSPTVLVGHSLEHIPSELTRGDSQRSVDERVCRP